MWSGLLATPVEGVLAAVAVSLTAVCGLWIAVNRVERRVVRPSTPARQRSRSVRRPAQHNHLTARDLARLTAFRSRARYMAGEPLDPPGWWRKVRHAWSEGYAGWVIACCVGSFSMATHFGAFWLIMGGGWLGAIVVTLGSTAAMVATCAWVGLGLIGDR